MPSSYVLPFKHKPIATGQTTTSYTVTTGRYARAVINASASAWFVKDDGAAANITNLSMSNSAGNMFESMEVWLNSGDVITYVTTIASLSVGISTAGASGFWESEGDYTTIEIRKNGNKIAEFRAAGAMSFSGVSSAALSFTIGAFTGQATVAIVYEEYV